MSTTKSCAQTSLASDNTEIPCDEFISTECVVHPDALVELVLPENSTVQDIINAFLNAIINLNNQLGASTNVEVVSGTVTGTDMILTKSDSNTVIIDVSSLLDDTNLSRIVSGAIVGTDLILTRDDSSTITIDVTTLGGGSSTFTSVQAGAGIDVDATDSDNPIISAQGLELVNEGGNIGWRLIGKDPANFGDIGNNAVDLSNSTSASTTVGATGDNSFLGGGVDNISSGLSTVVGGGQGNIASIGFTSVVGGLNNSATNQRAFVGGGSSNIASGQVSSIVGGQGNEASSTDSIVGAGTNNTSSGDSAGILAGTNNSATGEDNFIGGGVGNLTSEDTASIVGGVNNVASARSAAVSGGEGNFARSFGEWTGGLYGTDYTPTQINNFFSGDRIFNIGNGFNTSNRSDALTILKTGEITAPSIDNTIIDAASGKVLITKEWFIANAPSGGGTPTGLEIITEGVNTGWRLIGTDPLLYGNIGANAIDLSFSPSASSTRGATGNATLAAGYQVTASGDFSTVTGIFNVASGNSAFATGTSTIAAGQAAFTAGVSIQAPSFAETTLGYLATTYVPVGTTTFNSADRAFTVGIGTDISNLKDGLKVMKNGEVLVPELTPVIIAAADPKIVVTKEYLEEEGTFTPVVEGHTTGGYSYTVGTSVGRYTRQGKVIHYDIAITGINTSGVAGTNVFLEIDGFPFSTRLWSTGQVILVTGFNFSSRFAEVITFQPYMTPGSSRLLFNVAASSASYTLPNSAMREVEIVNGSINISGSFVID